jgi:hypothetical protein
MRNRGIGRGRMFMGALLLLAALMTWSIGLMMSPHGETVAKGTEHLRTTIVIFKRNGAIGTLILCALGAWLLFPARRLRWPARDWTLIALIVFLAGSSLYTLIWLTLSVPHTGNFNENLASANMDLNEGSDMNSIGVDAAPSADWNQAEISAAAMAASQEAKGRARSELQPIPKAELAREPQNAEPLVASPANEEEPADNSAEQNQE